MIRYLDFEVVRKLNYFLVKVGVSPYYTPITIVDKQTLGYKIHRTIIFGALYQANNDNNPKFIFCKQLTAFIYDHWKKYKGGMRYLVYTVKELLQDGKLLKFQFLRK